MTESSASTGVSVPAMYIGQPDYTLSVSDEHAEPFDITASVDGSPIITGHDFRGPAMGTDPRDDPSTLASVFGSFLGAEIERERYAMDPLYHNADGPIWAGWTLHDPSADLSSLADACALYGEDESSC